MNQSENLQKVEKPDKPLGENFLKSEGTPILAIRRLTRGLVHWEASFTGCDIHTHRHHRHIATTRPNWPTGPFSEIQFILHTGERLG